MGVFFLYSKRFGVPLLTGEVEAFRVVEQTEARRGHGHAPRRDHIAFEQIGRETVFAEPHGLRHVVNAVPGRAGRHLIVAVLIEQTVTELESNVGGSFLSLI